MRQTTCDQSEITLRPFLLRTGEDRDGLQSFSSAAADNAKLSASEGSLSCTVTPLRPLHRALSRVTVALVSSHDRCDLIPVNGLLKQTNPNRSRKCRVLGPSCLYLLCQYMWQRRKELQSSIVKKFAKVARITNAPTSDESPGTARLSIAQASRPFFPISCTTGFLST